MTDLRDFGVAISLHDTMLFVTGISYDSANNSAKVSTLRLRESDGSVVWISQFGSGYNLPTKITTDKDGNPLVGGMADMGSGEKALFVVKYNATDGSQQWATYYDSLGSIESVVGMDYEQANDELKITGYSGSNTLSWNFVSFSIDASSGTKGDVKLNGNGNGSFVKPVGIGGDQFGNTLVVGTCSNPVTAKGQLKIVFYDSLWNEQYVKLYSDSLLHTEANDMKDDYTGGQAVLCTQTNASGLKNMQLYRIDKNSGNLLWVRNLPSSRPGEDAIGAAVVVGGWDNNIYISGSFGSGNQSRAVTAAYDLNGNLLFLKEYNHSPSSRDVAKTIEVDEDGNPTMTCFSTDSAQATYVSVGYKIWTAKDCGILRNDCPTITYQFKNGEITNIGTDTFVEFDVYAKQNFNNLKLREAKIILTYNKEAFGDSIVNQNNIIVSKGNLINSNAYSIGVADTLFNSDIVENGCTEFLIDIKNIDTSNLELVPDTFIQLCHIKMKMKRRITLKVFFDRFFMQDKSIYRTNLIDRDFNFVCTGKLLVLATASVSPNLYYKIDNFQLSCEAILTCDVKAYADQPVDVYGSDITINYDNFALKDNPIITYENWCPPATNPNNPEIKLPYDGYLTNAPGLVNYLFNSPYYDIDSLGTNGFHQWSNTFEQFFKLEFKINFCNFNPTLKLSLPINSANYYIESSSGIVSEFNTSVTGLFEDFCCNTGIDALINKGEINLFPNPFHESITMSFDRDINLKDEIEIHNAEGRQIMKMPVNETSIVNRNISISLSGVSGGLYYITIVLADGTKVRKLMIKD